MGGWMKIKLMRCQLFILMNGNCWWPESSLYTSFQISSGHLSSPSGHLRASCLHRPVVTVRLSPHVMADCLSLSSCGSGLGDAMADRGWCNGGPWPRCSCGGGPGLQGSCQGPWWRKCGFYPPANPVQEFTHIYIHFVFILWVWNTVNSYTILQGLREGISVDNLSNTM